MPNIQFRVMHQRADVFHPQVFLPGVFLNAYLADGNVKGEAAPDAEVVAVADDLRLLDGQEPDIYNI